MADELEPKAFGTQSPVPAEPPTVDLSPADVHDPATSTPTLPQSAEADSDPIAADYDQPTLSLPSGLPSTPRSAEVCDQPAQAPSAAALEVRPFGDYELLGEIARGGMGIVYRARERHSGRLVALKMMLAPGTGDSVDLRRFILEARATGELSHPGIVAIHAWGEHDGHSFYTMDYVPGSPLHRILNGNPLPIARAVRYLLGIARAVATAHAQGIVHRDLKPSNIIIDATDRPRVLDFGLAKRLRQDSVPEKPGEDVVDVLPAADTGRPNLAAANVTPGPSPGQAAKAYLAAPSPTARGIVLGTPSYMSPEQARGEQGQVGPAADVHALGALFFEMLSGRPPFLADTVADTLNQVMEQQPPSLRTLNPRVPATLEAFCRRCLEKDPAARYSHAGALADDLEQRWHRAAQSRRFARLTLVMGLILLALAGVQRWGTMDWDWWRQWAQEAAAAGGPMVRNAAGLLAPLLGGFFLGLVPAFSQLALVVWLGAWFWYTDRLYLYVVWLVTAAGLWGLSAWTEVWLLPIWLPPLVAGVALAVAVSRWLADREESRARQPEPEADPYLQKLFAVRVESAPRVSSQARAGTKAAVELADVELGKVVYEGTSCRVRKARQKSLDRPVLVWQYTLQVVEATPTPGVVVHHPYVLTLHAVGTSPEGRYLVTEAAAATPLAELLERRGLEPQEAVFVLVRMAHALQAFHDQGAVHGRLSPQWILVRGDLEPLLCPCGIPSQVAGERVHDVIAVARLLREWLPPRPRRWRQRSLAGLYRVGDAAAAGEYTRPVELAEDLDRAARAALVRWRERVASGIVLALFVLPLLLLAFAGLTERFGWLEGMGYAGLADIGSLIRKHLLLALAPSALLLGYLHGRILALHYRWRLRRAARRRFFREGILPALTQAALVTALPGLIACYELSKEAQPVGFSVLFLGMGPLLGFWFLGLCLTALVTFAELLVGSIRPPSSSMPFGSLGLIGGLPETSPNSREAARTTTLRAHSRGQEKSS